MPKGILLFHSPYLKDGRSLVFPLRKQRANEDNYNKSNIHSDSYISRIRKWFSLGVVYENVGSEEFLNEARNILIHERTVRIEARRQKTINKRNKEMRRGIKEIRKYIAQSSSTQLN